MANNRSMNRMKVAWLCHVSDPDINDQLRPLKRSTQVAPWITNTANHLSQCDELELHVISPHEYISGIKRFNRKGVYYYFYNQGIPFWGRHWPGVFKFDLWTDYAYNKRIIKLIIKEINPDIIHLQGAENAYYSSTIFQFMDKYPVVVNLQRMTLNFCRGESKYAKKTVKVEKEILSIFKHFSTRTNKMTADLLEYNSKAVTHFVRYSMTSLTPLTINKEYDLVYFAQIAKSKGIEDLIHCLSIVKKQIPNITLCVMGSTSSTYMAILYAMVQDLDLNNNIIWKGFLPSLEDVHREASKAKISVLPTYYDIIPGTIIESMQLGLPVVSYKAGSIPELNDDMENVLLVEIGDIEGMAKNIVALLTNDDLYKTMSMRGVNKIKTKYNNEYVIQQHMRCYKSVIEDFHTSKGTK